MAPGGLWACAGPPPPLEAAGFPWCQKLLPQYLRVRVSTDSRWYLVRRLQTNALPSLPVPSLPLPPASTALPDCTAIPAISATTYFVPTSNILIPGVAACSVCLTFYFGHMSSATALATAASLLEGAVADGSLDLELQQRGLGNAVHGAIFQVSPSVSMRPASALCWWCVHHFARHVLAVFRRR